MNPLDFLNAQYRSMPPVAAMQIQALSWDGDALRLRAPIAANVNDKHSAFGGSLASIMTLAAWGMLTLKLQQCGIQAQVYVADSHVRYLKPLYADLLAEARLEPEVDWDHVLHSYRDRGRARAAVVSAVLGPEGEPMATLTGRFAALRAD
ncbi:YiiD C-terminal domain-containing protein [Arenimonas sp. MALMAid1274]|uniref:YiiD C-terminal domain-containing protein n=1 Tax=Arenimonas sp. MALMAid1274 TaxID=3411630 RepID=UPI003BA102B1